MMTHEQLTAAADLLAGMTDDQLARLAQMVEGERINRRTEQASRQLDDLEEGDVLADGRTVVRVTRLRHLATRELLAARVTCDDGSVVRIRPGSHLLQAAR